MPAEVLKPTRPLALPEVTLAVVTSIAPRATARALAQSCRDITFGAVLWISDLPPPDTAPKDTTWHRIEPISTRNQYSQFILRKLAGLVDTSHVLLIQWDGYVLEAGAWDPAFLAFDYIGPVWPQFPDMTVGNGGFSLRSRRLLEASTQLPNPGGEAEDVFICRSMRPRLEAERGIRFASPEIAERFGYERARTGHVTFGFHGVFNLVDLVSDTEAAALIAELPLHSLSRGELRELMASSLRCGRWHISRELLRRWRRWL